MRPFIRVTLASILLVVGTASMAKQSEAIGRDGIAGGWVEPVTWSGSTQQGDGMTLSQAVEQVRRQYNGRIVSAETVVNGGRETHVIKVLTSDGKVKTVRIPGRRV